MNGKRPHKRSCEEDVQEEEFDEYEPDHIQNHSRPARAKKQKTSLKHLQSYIDKHYSHHPGLARDTVAEELPHEFVCSEEFVGCYLKWIADDARYLKHDELLAHSSCLGYASSFSEYFLNKYRSRPVPLTLSKEKWSKKIALITTIKADYCFRERKKMSQEKETATTEDRLSMSSICIWQGTNEGAELHCFSNYAVNVAGRGSDIADTELKDISCKKKDFGVISHRRLHVDVTRFKTSTKRNYSVAPHWNSFLLCLYFGLAYSLVMNSESIRRTGKLFPNFATKVFNKDAAVDSKVSSHFNKLIDKIWNVMFDFFYGKHVVLFLSEPSNTF